MKNHYVESVPLNALACALAIAMLATPVVVRAQTDVTPVTTPADEDPGAATLDTVSVTGTLLRGIAPTSTNVVGITREDIQVLGKGSLNDLLATTPQVTNLFNAAPMPSAELGLPVIRPNIRNLGGSGGSTTLLLLNGQRMVGSGIVQTSPDPWVVPVAVLERVEVMMDGGSATYGSDAIGGVINFITRRRFDGVEISSRYGAAAGGYWQMDSNLTMGRDWGSGSALLSYSYVEHDNLPARARSYLHSDHRDRGGDDYRVLNCAPGNVIVGDEVYGITPSGFGAPNLCDEHAVIDFYPKERRSGVFGVLTQRLGERVVFDATGYWSERSTRRNGISTRDGPGLRGRGTITSANPWFRPVGSETGHRIEFNFSPVAGTDALVSPQKFTSMGLTPTLTWSFADDWQLKASGNYGRSVNIISTRQVNAGAIAAALAGTTPDTALNPYELSLTNPALLPTLLNYESYGWSEQEISALRSVADGSVLSLPAGDVKLAIGAEYYREAMDAAYGQGPITMADLSDSSKTASRHVWSVFAETMLPVLGDDAAAGALDLSISWRYDHYDDVGSTTNPKIGLTWYPLDYLRIRGNWGSSFHAPSMADTNGAVDTRAQVLGNSLFRQPGSPDSDFLRPTILLAGGNPDLQPEQADTWSLGFDWTPAGGLDGLSVSVTYYNIKFTDAITLAPFFNPVALYNNPGFVEHWTINPTREQANALTAGMWVENAPSIDSLYDNNTPPYVIIDARRNNLGGMNFSGLDFNLGYTRPLGLGDLILNVGGTYHLKRDVSANAVSPMVSQIDLSSRYTALASVGYNLGDFRSQLLVRTSDGYAVSAGSPQTFVQTKISSFTVADLSFGWELGRDDWLPDTRFSFNIDNILNRAPPFLHNADGYGNGSTLGRLFMIGVSKKF